MRTENFLVERREGILKIIVNRPEQRNSFKIAMWAELREIVEQSEHDQSIKVIIITGAGDNSFTAGADISEMTDDFPPAVNGQVINPVAPATRALQNAGKVVIAMINGYAIGGGCELALGCDLRIAADTAQIGITSAKVGICLGFETIKRLVDLVGPSKAKDILITGRLLPANEALSIGLLDYVVPKQELESVTWSYAETILRNAPLSVMGAKETVNIISRFYPTPEVSDEYFISRKCFKSADFREGVRAFLEKRRPQFEGR
jgi:enoyl-CoA hydratase/carnithine racemase